MKLGVFTLAAIATAKTENFYKNGLDKISSDFETMLANSDIEEKIVKRYMRKVKQNMKRLQAKHKKLKRMDTVTFPALDGDLEIEESSVIDPTQTCKAVDLIEKDWKNWAKFFVEAAVKKCKGSKCFVPTEGPLESIETHKKWHDRNMKYLENFSWRVGYLANQIRYDEFCGKFDIQHAYI